MSGGVAQISKGAVEVVAMEVVAIGGGAAGAGDVEVKMEAAAVRVRFLCMVLKKETVSSLCA